MKIRQCGVLANAAISGASRRETGSMPGKMVQAERPEQIEQVGQGRVIHINGTCVATGSHRRCGPVAAQH